LVFTPEWQAAIEGLMLVAELGGPTMFARIRVIRALNRHIERVIEPSRKKLIGAAGSRRGIDDPLGHATAQCRNESPRSSFESKVLWSCVRL
jgi:hypothetical protein